MATEYHSIKWVSPNIATRRTREVSLQCEISKEAIFIQDEQPIQGVAIRLTGTADCEHHLIEDSAIFLKKICDAKCGDHSI